jgi:hypothetical protein
VVIANTYIEHSRRDRFNLLRLICVERRPDRCNALAERLAGLPSLPKLDVAAPRPGSLQDCFAAMDAAAHGGDLGAPVLWNP